MALSQEQRAGLLRAQLVALVRDLVGVTVEATTVGANATAVSGDDAYVLSQEANPATLAGALTWSLRQDASHLVLILDDVSSDVARMARHFDHPIEVRSVSGATSVVAVASALPTPLDAPEAPELVNQLRAAGLDVVVEDGIVRGEVRGLEVARLVLWPEETGGDGLLHLEAGVGRFDRDAVAAMHQGEPPTTTLERTVGMVSAERVPGRSTHPLSRLARDRWLRWSVLGDPALVGAAELEPIETTVSRDSVRDVSPAAAKGRSSDGEPMVVVCSAGVDLSLVPVAADTRERCAPGARLVLAVPVRDRVPTLDRLAALLSDPAEVVTLPSPWDLPDGGVGSDVEGTAP